MPKNNNKKPTQDIPIERKLFEMADKLRKNIDAAEYKHIVLGLIFLKYISDSFEELYNKIKNGEGDYADDPNPEERDYYIAENVFYVPKEARWSYLLDRAKLPSIKTDVVKAMEELERENFQLKGILPKDYTKPNLDEKSLGGLLDLVGSINLMAESEKNSRDILGKVYEYFLGEFALAEGKKGGQFYTPECIVKLLVEILQPYKGRVFDPCCGSGGMFVMSEKFIMAHQGKVDDIAIYGQESNQTTWKLCRMNLAIRGINGELVKWNTEGSFLKDLHPDLKADFILANPPFNDSNWSGELLRNDARWKYGVPPVGNANFAWVQHFIYHLSPKGRAGFVLSNGSLSSNTSNEGEIRKNIIEDDLIDCIITLPDKLFYNTGIPASLWFINRNKGNGKFKSRVKEILFIDARNLGQMISRKQRIMSDEDIQKIANTYHQWRQTNGKYKDVKGYCKSATIDDVKKNNYVLTPGRYVGSAEIEMNYEDFEKEMKRLTEELKEQIQQSNKLDKTITNNLAKLGF